ncbi:MAG: lipoate--protein ligase [Clostridia bacterium]
MNMLISTVSTDPWYNLALEELLFDTHRSGVLLYLWQNSNTVVIGRHQNAWKECRIAELENDGGRLARRTSGGGAVFHDLGNLNFTFITKRDEYDLPRQLSVITAAAGKLGINTHFTGRNDIVTDSGAKFSGNAFRFSASVGMHHGTILINSDMDKLARYLRPSAQKLAAKGVESVRSRVVNLASISPITVDDMRLAITSTFADEYGDFTVLYETALSASRLTELRERHASFEWRCARTPDFDMELSHRFDWGEVLLQLCCQNGLISKATVYSDAMDVSFISRISPALTGCQISGAEMAQAMLPLGGESEDIALWLRYCGL